MSADAATPPAADAPPSKGKALVPFILALVVGLAAGAGSGLFVVGPAMANGITPVAAASHKPKKHATAEDDEAESDEASADEEEEGDDEEADGGEEAKGGEHGGGEAAASSVYTLDNLVLNPAQSGGTRFLLLSITFQTKNAKLLEQMKARDAELRDEVLLTLGAKTVEQLADMTQRDSLKVGLADATKKLLKAKKKVPLRVYFPQFVIQ